MKRIFLGLSALATALPFAIQPAAADIGTVAAVNRDMDGTPPEGARRSLGLGTEVVRDERIETSTVGSGQLMFLDQTTLTVAPGSNIVLDNYVYDPEVQEGQIALSVARGALRFIGGRITKTSTATVRTPVATIGIRGALTTITVADDGATDVILAAGEFVTVTDNSGRTVTLSRPNASASVPAIGPVTFTGLAEAEDYEEAYAAFEGSGDGGSENTGNASAEQTDSGSGQVAAINSGVPGGETRRPVSTSGEQPASESDETVTVDAIGTDPDDDIAVNEVEGGTGGGSTGGGSTGGGSTGGGSTGGGSTGGGNTGGGSTGTGGTGGTGGLLEIVPTDGGVFAPELGFQSFQVVEEGSLIGTTAAGEVVTIPVPTDSAEFVSSLSNGFSLDFFALTLSSNAGFFEFGPDTANDEITGDTTTLGPLAGVGFSDLDEGFHAYEFVTDPAVGPVENGLVLFGTPSPRQASVLGIDEGTAPSTANTVSVYRVEPQLSPEGDGADEAEDVLLIANGGQARFPHPSHSLPSDGGRILAARAEQSPVGGGLNESSFFVFSPQLFKDLAGGLRFGGAVLDTSTFVDSSGSTLIELAVTNLGTVEDAATNTVFGSDDNYFVISSLLRESPTAPLTLDPGFSRLLGGTDFTEDASANIVTRVPTADEILTDPFPIALNSAATTTSPIMFGFATGMAACSSGTCNAPVGSTGDEVPGFFPVSGDAFAIFDNGSNVFLGTGPDTNTLQFVINAQALGTTSIAGAVSDDFTFSSGVGAAAPTAYLSDTVFGGVSDFPASIAGTTNTTTQMIFASSGLAGDAGIFPAGVASESQFLTWGWWSATYQVTDSDTAAAREDAIHMGNFVLGAEPNASLLPSTGVVGYDGFAVGTRVTTLGTTGSSSTLVAGSYNLQYDFGTATGTASLSIDGFNFNNFSVAGDSDNSHAYGLAATDVNGADLIGDGRFFSGNGNPVAATAGSFGIESPDTSTNIVGVFGADAE